MREMAAAAAAAAEAVDVRRAAVLSVSTETYPTDAATRTGRPRYQTDVKVWTTLAAASEPSQLYWDPVKQRFDLPSDPDEDRDLQEDYVDEDEPEPEGQEEPSEPEEEIVEEEPPKPEEEEPKPPEKKKKKKRTVTKKKMKKKPKATMEDLNPQIIWAKPRQMKKSK